MPPPPAPARIAVLDICKTTLELLVASDDGWPLETIETVIPLGAAGFDRPSLSAAYQSWIALSEQAL